MQRLTIPAHAVEPGDIWRGDDGHFMKFLKIMKREQRIAVPFDAARTAPPRPLLHIVVMAEFHDGHRFPFTGQYTLQGQMEITVERER